MTGLFAVLGLAGPLSLIVALFVIALLSQRLGTITKRARHYRWLFAAIALVLGALITRLSIYDAAIDSVYSLLMAFALTIGVGVAWFYWGWLLNERQHSHDAQEGHSPESTSR
jgi:high-affinity Fe2+/Pb2+ permease